MEISVKLPLFPETERENCKGNTCLGHFQTRKWLLKLNYFKAREATGYLNLILA